MIKDMENLVGKIVEVIVSKNGKVASKNLKVCKVKARSVLFIEVDRENRKNTFRKFNVKNIETVGIKTDGGDFVLIQDGILPDKWESPWDAISTNPVKMSPWVKNHGSFNRNGHGSYNFFPTTTNSNAGFPMV